MNPLKRLKNLWKLSGVEVDIKDDRLTVVKKPEDKPRMAQIISMRDPVKEVLREE